MLSSFVWIDTFSFSLLPPPSFPCLVPERVRVLDLLSSEPPEHASSPAAVQSTTDS